MKYEVEILDEEPLPNGRMKLEVKYVDSEGEKHQTRVRFPYEDYEDGTWKKHIKGWCEKIENHEERLKAVKKKIKGEDDALNALKKGLKGKKVKL